MQSPDRGRQSRWSSSDSFICCISFQRDLYSRKWKYRKHLSQCPMLCPQLGNFCSHTYYLGCVRVFTLTVWENSVHSGLSVGAPKMVVQLSVECWMLPIFNGHNFGSAITKLQCLTMDNTILWNVLHCSSECRMYTVLHVSVLETQPERVQRNLQVP